MLCYFKEKIAAYHESRSKLRGKKNILETFQQSNPSEIITDIELYISQFILWAYTAQKLPI